MISKVLNDWPDENEYKITILIGHPMAAFDTWWLFFWSYKVSVNTSLGLNQPTSNIQGKTLELYL